MLKATEGHDIETMVGRASRGVDILSHHVGSLRRFTVLFPCIPSIHMGAFPLSSLLFILLLYVYFELGSDTETN
jgi:hypothetical protein